MSFDLTASTEVLRSNYGPMAEKIKKLRNELKYLQEEVEPLRNELVKRDNAATLILNAVMSGQQALLRAAGTSEDVIKQAEAWFENDKARKAATSSEREVA